MRKEVVVVVVVVVVVIPTIVEWASNSQLQMSTHLELVST